MRSDAILQLFLEHYLQDRRVGEHLTVGFAEHLAATAETLTPSDLAFLLRVGGQLVRQHIDDSWESEGVAEAGAMRNQVATKTRSRKQSAGYLSAVTAQSEPSSSDGARCASRAAVAQWSPMPLLSYVAETANDAYYSPGRWIGPTEDEDRAHRNHSSGAPALYPRGGLLADVLARENSERQRHRWKDLAKSHQLEMNRAVKLQRDARKLIERARQS